MQTYIGTKIIKALSMTRLEYCGYRGWELPENEQHLAQEAGMLVEYADTRHPNVAGHEGYVSWSPLDVFSEAYELTSGMSFGLAVEALRKGAKVARAGWNGVGMFVTMTPGKILDMAVDDIWTGNVKDIAIANGGTVEILPYMSMKTADDKLQIGWLASQSDMIANDWYIVG